MVLLLISCFSSCGGKDENNSGSTAVKQYPVISITPQSTTLETEFPATIEGQQNVEIRPKVDGYIEEIFVDEGATVKIGQKLFRISVPHFEQEVRTAEANIKIAVAEVNAAKMQVNKVRPLVEKKIVSDYELKSAEYSLQSKQAALAQAEATLANARTNIGYTLIASPVDGVVGVIPYKIGSLVNSNTTQPLTTVSDISKIYAYFSINEKQALEFSKSTKGKTTEDRLASLPPVSLILSNGSEFPPKGRIETASGLVNTQTGSVRVRATFPNPGNIVKSGSSGTVVIPANLDSAMVIPQKSTYEIQGKKFVYKVEKNGSISSQAIDIMENSGGQFFVVEEGLNVGDKIVLEGVESLREGVQIKPKLVSNLSLK